MVQVKLDQLVEPDEACVRYSVCGNTVRGNGEMCAECLDWAREQDKDGRISSA